ncbi:Oidioi.mRNA.OKI2018_I69.PAR.g9993.t1.cds [Oikopleura dioica]|uniref:Oidioi.mRNA.OKI2018_I69.PAR.g9993.t1.cds n=1 Tax=Oikopleura dioica TaxID=34765 RepID=A0ABN7RPC1_OIKDI|nr:Oidioi.mRNA.OKI2018_I69.PAR.g9993.t1.cds [Oikopleura dioica]
MTSLLVRRNQFVKPAEIKEENQLEEEAALEDAPLELEEFDQEIDFFSEEIPSKPVGTASSCPAPHSVKNASFDYKANSSTASYSCNPGFCFENERTRTIISDCKDASWSAVPSCQPCDACELPEVETNQNSVWNENDWTATISCVEEEAVLKPGTDIRETKISCIEGKRWNKPMPVCSKPSKINCGDDHIEVIVDKNLFKAKRWEASSSNVFLHGNSNGLMSIDEVDSSCFAKEDEEGNYRVRIQAPFMGQCGTKATVEDGNYVFENKVKWRMETDFTVKDAEVLDFSCKYRGVFMAGISQPVKIAINTKTYQDPRTNQDFTVSMSVYDHANFTGLVNNIPLLHRGKRYFVDLHLHSEQIGTPFLKYCYGSKNYVSEAELREKYKTETSSSGIRSMVVNGCPAAGTLVRLEESPNSFQSRYSFMFPKIGIQGRVDLQFVYLHCEIEFKPAGFKPNCENSMFEQVLRQNFDTLNGPAPQKLLRKFGPRFNQDSTIDGESRQDAVWKINCQVPLFKNAPRCLKQQEEAKNRQRRSLRRTNMAVGFGPIIFPENENDEIDEEVVVEEVLRSSKLFVDENSGEIEVKEEEVEVIPNSQVDQIEILWKQHRTKKSLIIRGMAFGCVFLFFLSMFVSSRVSCFPKSDKELNISSKF